MVDHKKSANVVKWNVSLSLMIRTNIAYVQHTTQSQIKSGILQQKRHTC